MVRINKKTAWYGFANLSNRLSENVQISNKIMNVIANAMEKCGIDEGR